VEPREAADMLEARLERPFAFRSRFTDAIMTAGGGGWRVGSVVMNEAVGETCWCAYAADSKGCVGEDAQSERQSSKSCSG
jgi:hypothetical protein